MTDASEDFDEAVAALRTAFPGARRLANPHDRAIRLPSVPLSGERWSPRSVRALLRADHWPGVRPTLLVGDEVLFDEAPPINFTRVMVADEAWLQYSFNAPYMPSSPALIPVIRGWLRRFDGSHDG